MQIWALNFNTNSNIHMVILANPLCRLWSNARYPSRNSSCPSTGYHQILLVQHSVKTHSSQQGYSENSTMLYWYIRPPNPQTCGWNPCNLCWVTYWTWLSCYHPSCPLVLYDLIPAAAYEAWLALSHTVGIVYQPSIGDTKEYEVCWSIVTMDSSFTNVHRLSSKQAYKACSRQLQHGIHNGSINLNFTYYSISWTAFSGSDLQYFLQQKGLRAIML